jgi:hypothetical protein
MEAGTEWDVTVAAFFGGILGTVVAVVHQVYVALFGIDLIVDPFVYVMTEMAVLISGGVVLFAVLAMLRNRFRAL